MKRNKVCVSGRLKICRERSGRAPTSPSPDVASLEIHILRKVLYPFKDHIKIENV
jgi:hypothetical protein